MIIEVESYITGLNYLALLIYQPYLYLFAIVGAMLKEFIQLFKGNLFLIVKLYYVTELNKSLPALLRGPGVHLV